MRVAIGLEYAGVAYHGWQSQPNQRTVQGVVEAAIAAIAGGPVSTVVAGRTDAGVHASAQVVHFDVDVQRPLTAWVRGVNSHLPDDVSVVWAREVGDGFHARFSAEGRRYRYYLLNRPSRPGVLAGRVGWDFHPLDAEKMSHAASCLLGEHDFSAFRAAECQANTPVRRVTRADVRVAGAAGEFLLFDFAANAFLHHMVRNFVGSLVHVGRGTRSPEWISDLIAARNRSLAAPTMMPDGLYLVGVDYPAHWGLPDGAPPPFPSSPGEPR